MADGRIFDIGAKTPEDSLNLSLAGTRKSMRCVVDAQALPQLLERLGSGHVGRFYVQDVDLELIKELQEQNRADKRHGHAQAVEPGAPGTTGVATRCARRGRAVH